MMAAMQAQQQKLLEPAVQQQVVNNNHLPMVKDLLSPLRQGAVHRVKHDQVGEKLAKFYHILYDDTLLQVFAPGKKNKVAKRMSIGRLPD